VILGRTIRFRAGLTEEIPQLASTAVVKNDLMILAATVVKWIDVLVSWESQSSRSTKAEHISEWNHLPLVDGEGSSGASSKVLEDGKLQAAACCCNCFMSDIPWTIV
jgi:hypothetical protein